MDKLRTCLLVLLFTYLLANGLSSQQVVNIQPYPVATVTENDSTTLTCSFSDNGVCPNKQVLLKWDLNGAAALTLGWTGTSCIMLNGKSNLQFSCRSVQTHCEVRLTLNQVKNEQHGDTWKCQSSGLSIETTIFVNAPVTSVEVTSPSTSQISVVENVTCDFECQTSASRPMAAIEWYKRSGSGTEVALPDGSRTTVTRGTLVITKSTLGYTVSRADDGYQVYCKANITGSRTVTSSRRPVLNILYAPVMHVIQNRVVIQASSVTVQCVTSPGNPMQTSYRWTRNRDNMIFNAQTMTINYVDKTDAGEYTCTAGNVMTPSKGAPVLGEVSTTFTLHVLYAPVIQSIQDRNVILSSSVSVQCVTAPGYPYQTSYRWTRSGSGWNQTGQTLSIANVASTDAGNYTCTAWNVMTPTSGMQVNGIDAETFTLNIILNGGWSSWSSWSSCTVSCGQNGHQTRQRNCSSPVPAHGGQQCSGNTTDSRTCSQACPEWSPWLLTPCSVTCGTGSRQGMRRCSTGHEEDCRGDAFKTESCVEPPCPVNGGWSSWSSWLSCSVSCGQGGHQIRQRNCTSPVPDHGGQPCSGNTTDSRTCSQAVQACPGWSPWLLTPCSVTCGTGSRQGTRRCSTGHEDDCRGDALKTESCVEPPCPVNGGWSSWSSWLSCSVSCGQGGHQTRQRNCTSPVPTHGGQTCSGNTTDSRTCSQAVQTCPEWSSWLLTPCSVTCGTGSRQGMRRCSTGDEKDCRGDALKTESCVEPPCPVDGSWGEWNSWDACSHTCGDGSRHRHRTCDHPSPAHGGLSCHGYAMETGTCHVVDCPHWGDYYEAGPCSVTSGQGVIQLQRNCSTGNNHDCSGSPYDEKPCSLPVFVG